MEDDRTKGQKFEKFYENFCAEEKPFISSIRQDMNDFPVRSIDYEDVMQESAIDCFKADITAKSNPKAYFKKAIKNRVKKFLKIGLSRRKNLNDSVSIDDEDNSDLRAVSVKSQIEENTEKFELAEKALQSLKKEQQKHIESIYWDEVSNEEFYEMLKKDNPDMTLENARQIRCRESIRFKKALENLEKTERKSHEK